MALMLCMLLQAVFHVAVLADSQGVATGAVTNGPAIEGVANGAAASVSPATGPVPIGATEKCPEGLTHRCLDDGCYCLRPSKPVIRPRPRPWPKSTPKPSTAKDAAVVDAATNGTAATVNLTNGAMPTVIPATGAASMDAMEKCPEGLIRRCLSDGCHCGKPLRLVPRPRPKPRPRPTSRAVAGATAIDDAAAGDVSKGAAVESAANNGATTGAAMTDGAAATGPIPVDATGKCPKGLRHRCSDDKCFCVRPQKHPTRPAFRAVMTTSKGSM